MPSSIPSPIPSSIHPQRINRNIKITNKCPKKVWVGVWDPNNTQADTGFELIPNSFHEIIFPDNWENGKIWGRTGCEFSSNGIMFGFHNHILFSIF